jgi:hypothetical protein
VLLLHSTLAALQMQADKHHMVAEEEGALDRHEVHDCCCAAAAADSAAAGDDAAVGAVTVVETVVQGALVAKQVL